MAASPKGMKEVVGRCTAIPGRHAERSPRGASIMRPSFLSSSGSPGISSPGSDFCRSSGLWRQEQGIVVGIDDRREQEAVGVAWRGGHGDAVAGDPWSAPSAEMGERRCCMWMSDPTVANHHHGGGCTRRPEAQHYPAWASFSRPMSEGVGLAGILQILEEWPLPRERRAPRWPRR